MPSEELLCETPRFRVVRREYRTAEGRSHKRAVIVHPGSVTILPLIDDATVCLIRNRRIAVGETLVELPAGTLEPNEAPHLAAARELEEECGFRAAHVQLLTSFWMSPGILAEQMHLYLATDLTEVPRQLDAGEEIETLPVTWTEALRMVYDGTIKDAKTVAGLLFYAQFRDVRQEVIRGD